MELTGQNGDLLSTPKGGSAGHEGDRLAHKSTTLPQLASGVQEGLELCRGNAVPEKAQKTIVSFNVSKSTSIVVLIVVLCVVQL